METRCHTLTEDTIFFNIFGNTSNIDIPFKGSFCSSCTSRGNFERVKNLIISFHLFEFGVIMDYTNFVKETLDYITKSNIFPNLKDVYILNCTRSLNYASSPDLNQIPSKYNLKNIYLNYFLLRSRFTVTYCSNFTEVDWQPNDLPALFFVGYMFKWNRLPIIHKFYKQDAFDRLNYSLNYNYIGNGSPDKLKNFDEFIYENLHNIDQYSELLFNGDRDALIDFILNSQKLIDTKINYRSDLFNQSVFNKSAYLLPAEWFQSPLILCMESYFFGIYNEENENIFSEKFWKTVLSKKPFIISSLNDHYYYRMEKLGFKTFLNYTSVPEKINTDNNKFNEKDLIDTYTQIAYNRTISFLDNMKINENKIANDIEHNYKLWKKLVDEGWENLLSDCPPLRDINILSVNTMFLMDHFENN
jgi:hypothetical protein